MSEYIKRESVDNVLIDLLGDIENDEECSCEFASGFEKALSYVEDRVKDIPSADVRPERHGEWLTDDSDTPYRRVQIYCSECDYFNLANIKSAYCPHCGAKMDGKDDK